MEILFKRFGKKKKCMFSVSSNTFCLTQNRLVFITYAETKKKETKENNVCRFI